MKEPTYILDNEKDESLNLKENFFKYAYKWPWFLASILLCSMIGLLVIRYSPVIFLTEAKIKIIDDSNELDIASDALSIIGAGSKINLDNEIAVIKSYRLLKQVVDTLGLDVSYYEVGNFKRGQVYNFPLKVSKLFEDKSTIKPIIYDVKVDSNGVKVINSEDGTKVLKDNSLSFVNTEFPVKIEISPDADLKPYREKDYSIIIKNKHETILELIDNIEVSAMSAQSDILSLKMKNENAKLSEAIINQLISTFNEDGIRDRRQVSKGTLDFIDDRFLFLSKELDSIEVSKKSYKQSNNLSYIEADAGSTIEKKSIAESQLFRIETQLELSKILKNTLRKGKDFSLLPADIGVENTNINSLVFEYNQGVLEREKLVVSAGVNNPAAVLFSSQLSTARKNIINTVNIYQKQLRTSLFQLKKQKNSVTDTFSKLPEKEKMLRAIERQQMIKENLFILLLQKREEAAISYAVTAPSIKVVDYGLTNLRPVSPEKLLILAISLFFGFLVPLIFFFTKFSFDTKIKSKEDLKRLSGKIPILAEIPALDEPNKFFDMNERSVKAESFRILSTNIDFLLTNKNKEKGNIIYVTSSVKGEGKTLIALNLATAYASLRKKVLLVGADLRNPQLHNFLNKDKNVTGLSDFLNYPDMNWKDCVNYSINENPFFDICFGGQIPPNAAQLIAGDNFKLFISNAAKEYDYVIVDTAPTVQVVDTLIMANQADATVFVVRSKYTEKKLIQFSKDLSDSDKLKNMAYVLNDISFSGSGYNYGYNYEYGS